MPVPAFGFSAGDFVSAISLVRKISKALKKTGGASTEYQHALIELKGLKNVLRHLESLEPNQENERHVNAIRGMALACQLPLREFLIKLEKYEASLGPFSSPQWFRGISQKSKWAVKFSEEVEKMRALVAAKTVSISLLLAMDLSTSLSKIEKNLGKRREQEDSELLSKIAEHRSTLNRVEGRITNIEEGIQQATQTSCETFAVLSSDVKALKAEVTSFKDVGQQVVSFVKSFPSEMRDLLQKILQSNWQIYHLLLSIQQTPIQSPTQLLDSNIQFEDAMGELIPLPYVYFRHWETFEGFLRSHFKGKIGEIKVDEGHYHILNVDKGEAIVRKDYWSRSIDQGAHISMSMIMFQLRRSMGKCPRPSCTGSRFVQHQGRTNLLTCEVCNLKFYAEAGELEDIFGRFSIEDEEEQVARQQVEEDLRIYGIRQEPLDYVDLDEDMQLTNLAPKRSASEFEAELDNPTKVRKMNESGTSNYEKVTAIDWNAGGSPMMAWVNQSAVPAAVPLHISQPPSVSKEEKILHQEKQEIEIFKKVNMSDALAPANDAKIAPYIENESDLDFGAQIYHRNIVDRYPLLPSHLARRLAIANHSRAERLQHSRLKDNPYEPIFAAANDLPQLPPPLIGANSENPTKHTPSIPVTMMPEDKTATGSHRNQTLSFTEKRFLCEYHENFPQKKKSELAAMFGIERVRVSMILSDKEYYLTKDICREPRANTRAQSKVAKDIDQLDGSAPWSSWSKITAAGSYSMAAAVEPATSNYSKQGGRSNMVDRNDPFLELSVAWTPYKNQESIPKFDGDIPEVYQHTLHNPAGPQLVSPSQNGFPRLRSVSPLFVSSQSQFQSTRPPDNFSSNGILVNGVRYACDACIDNDRVRSCKHTDRPLNRIDNHRSGKHTAPSPSIQKGASSPKPGQDFWTGRRQSHRPSSVKSYGSSRNSSLHGSPVMDPSYQSPAFSTGDQSHGSPNSGNSPRSLFPAPIQWTPPEFRDEIDQNFSFDCEICGELVKVSRRLDWQKHVMNDLRPYACMFEECDQADETYASLKDLKVHELYSHQVSRWDGIVCLFCRRHVGDFWKQGHRKHVGQHMEEIAFMVVPKAYEDWEFYSESSSGKQADKTFGAHLQYQSFPCPVCSQQFSTQYQLSIHQPNCHAHKCERINANTGKQCNSVFSRWYDLRRHEDTIHNSRKNKVRCEICTEEKTFSRNDALTRHMRVIHPDVDFPGKKRRGVKHPPRDAA